MQIEQRAIESLIPYINNSRLHSEDQVSQIAASIKEFGFNNPILVDGDNGIIAGHGRLLAARDLGIDTVPCIELSQMSKSFIRNGAKDVFCADCKTEFSVRKDTNPKVCKRCSSVRGGKSMLGVYRSPRQECKSCGAKFYAGKKQTYCSVDCRSKDARTDRKCKCCGSVFNVYKSSFSSKTNSSCNFCSRKCYEKYLCRTDRVTGRGSRWARIRKEIIKSFPFCAACGTTKRLQVHHIIPYRLSKNNKAYNLVPLCIKHHRWIETIFVETESYGVNNQTKFIWINMIRAMQSVTAYRILEIKRAGT